MTANRAYRQVRTALKNGVLKRPARCSRCNAVPGLASDGRAKIHAHHHDYSKPLDVEWLCTECHRQDTPFPIGERSGHAKLTDNLVREIRASRETGVAIARKLGLHPRTIQRARRGDSWPLSAAEASKEAK